MSVVGMEAANAFPPTIWCMCEDGAIPGSTSLCSSVLSHISHIAFKVSEPAWCLRLTGRDAQSQPGSNQSAALLRAPSSGDLVALAHLLRIPHSTALPPRLRTPKASRMEKTKPLPVQLMYVHTNSTAALTCKGVDRFERGYGSQRHLISYMNLPKGNP